MDIRFFMSLTVCCGVYMISKLKNRRGFKNSERAIVFVYLLYELWQLMFKKSKKCFTQRQLTANGKFYSESFEVKTTYLNLKD